jgi:hypothetical protein
MITPVPKLGVVRDRRYLDSLRDERCILTGQFATQGDAVIPMHIGTLGKGIKRSDDEALPVLDSLHKEGHQHGEITMLRKHAPDDVLRAAFRALARERYRKAHA